jgi:hypothetical protein
MNYFPRMALNHDLSNLCLLSRITGVSHQHLAEYVFLEMMVGIFGNTEISPQSFTHARQAFYYISNSYSSITCFLL